MAVEENKPSFSTLLFITADGGPVKFHMAPCIQKRVLQSLVEVCIISLTLAVSCT